MCWRILAASLLAPLMTSSAAWAASPPVWQGQFLVTAVTAQCGAFVNPGDVGTAVYAPDLDPAKPYDRLAMFFSRYAVVIATNDLTQRNRDRSLRSGKLVNEFSVRSDASTEDHPGVSFLDIYPPNITAATGEVILKGSISSFFSTPGCDMRLQATLVVQP